MLGSKSIGLSTWLSSKSKFIDNHQRLAAISREPTTTEGIFWARLRSLKHPSRSTWCWA